MVLELRQHDLVAGTNVGVAPRVRHQVDGLRGAGGPDDFVAAAADERGDRVSRVLVRLRRARRERVRAAVYL